MASTEGNGHAPKLARMESENAERGASQKPSIASTRRICVSAMADDQGVEFLGIRFDFRTIDDAALEIMNQEPGCNFRYVVTPNVLHLVQFHESRAILEPIYRKAWRVLCDSRVLSLLARLEGYELPVAAGSDLTARLLERASAYGLKIAIIGSGEADCAELNKKFPALRIERHTPPMGFIESEAQIQRCMDFVLKTRAPLVFLALGTPKQEILASRIADHPEARGVGLCVGAAIDFLTGQQRRAPHWMQHAGLEWLFRLISHPKRMAARYLLECPRIFYIMLASKTYHAPFSVLNLSERHYFNPSGAKASINNRMESSRKRALTKRGSDVSDID
jgi:N-acetylglucosaminyldiphosphoundecaprenol N-acetyl-beta-D-mannosaminyltransferase